MMQTLESDYMYTQPLKLLNIVMLPIYNYKNCPCYAPIVPDSMCRLCYRTSSTHKKYYIYSNYARKIQMQYLKYKFNKFYRNNINLFHYT
jgi:hypothetical protein